MYCKNCGKEILGQAKFCSNCGIEIKRFNKSEKIIEAAEEKVEETKTENTNKMINEEKNAEKRVFLSETISEKVSQVEIDKTTDEFERENLKVDSIESSDVGNEDWYSEEAEGETKEKIDEPSAINNADERSEFVCEEADATLEKAVFAQAENEEAREKSENFLRNDKAQSVLDKVKENKAIIIIISTIIVVVLMIFAFSCGGEIYGSWEVAERSIGEKFKEYPEDGFSIYENGTFTCDGISGIYYMDDDYLTLSAFWISHRYEYKVNGNTLRLKNVKDEDSIWIYYDRVS